MLFFCETGQLLVTAKKKSRFLISQLIQVINSKMRKKRNLLVREFQLISQSLHNLLHGQRLSFAALSHFFRSKASGIHNFFGYAVGINNKLQRYSRSTYYQRKRISKLPTRNFLQIFLMTYYDRAILFNTIDVVLECKILEF